MSNIFSLLLLLLIDEQVSKNGYHILHCTTMYGYGWEELISRHTCIQKNIQSTIHFNHLKFILDLMCMQNYVHVLYKYTYEGVIKLSASKCNGGSALKGFKEVGLRAGCLLGSN